MNGIFQINNFRGICINEFQADSFFLYEKISRNLDFHKFLWKINGAARTARFFIALLEAKLANDAA